MKAQLKPGPTAKFGVDLALPQVGGSARKTNKDYTAGQLPELIDIIIEEKAALCPDLRLLELDAAWAKLFAVLVIMYCFLTFGWSGSPGRFGAFALAAELATASAAPTAP